MYLRRDPASVRSAPAGSPRDQEARSIAYKKLTGRHEDRSLGTATMASGGGGHRVTVVRYSIKSYGSRSGRALDENGDLASEIESRETAEAVSRAKSYFWSYARNRRRAARPAKPISSRPAVAGSGTGGVKVGVPRNVIVMTMSL